MCLGVQYRQRQRETYTRRLRPGEWVTWEPQGWSCNVPAMFSDEVGMWSRHGAWRFTKQTDVCFPYTFFLNIQTHKFSSILKNNFLLHVSGTSEKQFFNGLRRTIIFSLFFFKLLCVSYCSGSFGKLCSFLFKTFAS